MPVLLDLTKPHVADAVATIAPAVPAEMVDAIAEHLARVPARERMDAAMRLAESLLTIAEARGPADCHKVAGVTSVALDMALRRFAGAAS